MATTPKPRKKPPVPDKGGRPSRYRPEYDEQARELCMLGYTDVRLAKFFTVTEKTLNTWKQRHPSFFSALRAGKETPNIRVASALFHRAIGYSHPEVDIKVVNGQIVKTELVKHYPPDTAAAALWLTNREPDLWKGKRAEQADDEGAGGPQPVTRIEIEVVPAKPKPAVD